MSADEISELAESLRARAALGRSDVLNRLFDYLAGVSVTGQTPKEFEVAAAVFGRDAGFDGAQDASVRVAVHRLRKKLEEYYAGPGRGDAVRLTVPRGEYRLEAVPAELAPVEVAPAERRTTPWAIALAALLALNLLAWAGWWASHPGDGLGPVRRAVPWSQLVGRARPLLVVVGDYYIFADMDQATGAGRLVREYGINSPEDLDNWLMDHPDAVGRYRDLDLFYLPVGVAAALRDVMPVLAPKAGARDQVRVITASDLTPEMLKRNDVLYVGYLSGLRMLRDPVFAGSRFRVGETYDELIDTRTGKHYESQEGGPDEGQSSQRDFGYFAAFRGPDGNRIVILAGDRDMGLMQTAEAMTNPAVLKAVTGGAGRADAFEALYEVDGMRHANFGGRLVLSSPLDAARIWAPPKAPIRFPQG
ncbi:MAG: winged helix family transcriptional regulator [Phenylobacterium sp.]|nr:MAG: winged helix family transcriptional regulator [Phenylobacterium sp.]